MNGTEEGKGEIGHGNGDRNGSGRGGTRKGTAKGEAGASGEGSGGRGEKRRSVTRECENIRDGRRVGRCRLDSAPKISVMDENVDWRQH